MGSDECGDAVVLPLYAALPPDQQVPPPPYFLPPNLLMQTFIYITAVLNMSILEQCQRRKFCIISNP